ncbi:MAG: type IX secretion system sortase PorU [Muribaculaceae bacterium]|nr:type IX secretion system sortase PorU [Muribaculaceae bacterium]
MNKRNIFIALFVIILLASTSLSASAFSASKYATTSKLSSGQWVKISIPEDGVYQITSRELIKMGFSNINDVKVYGAGGHPISEMLDGSAPDDLVQVPSKIVGNKIVFYGCGPVGYTLEGATTSPHFTRTFNSYSQQGYYFLTSDSSPRVEPANVTYGITGTRLRDTSLDYYHHETEAISASQSGKDMLGEAFVDKQLQLTYNIPSLCGDSAIMVNTCVAVKSKDTPAYLKVNFNNKQVPFDNNDIKIPAAPSEYTFYNFISPYALVQPTTTAPIPASGTINFNITGNPNWSKLDYFILTFHHRNTLENSVDNQVRMNFNQVSSSDIIAVTDDNPSLLMWNIDNPQAPKNYNLKEAEGYRGFTPLYTIETTQFIAFDPTQTLKSITGYDPVENQNIHGLPTPDMVIVTCKELLEQASRVARMHITNDKMIVHVIDQDLIFNEFSSGTPDAMAIRLMNKMFYDRDSSKFKYLIMFGAGSQDNRQILAKRPCTILTYESTGSHDETSSYVSDDFFGMLEDNSGKNPANELLLLGVGRIPCASLEEAESDVDKLLDYVNNPDYGPWRNNALLIADYYEEDHNLHAYQAEGLGNIIASELGLPINRNKVFLSQFPYDSQTKMGLEARQRMTQLLKDGQYFMTYVGHGNGMALTHEYKLWTTLEARNTTYPHLPIITTACCDVARYDGNIRGLLEIMFHKPKGGAIAMVTTTRSAYASGNDALNQAFIRNMFGNTSTGQMPTIGEVYMRTKQSFGHVTSYNKMMFVLIGDPAIKINYPKPYFKINKINGYTIGSSNIATGELRQITIEAAVYTPDGSQIDTSFNGDATLAIYDYEKKELTENGRDIFFPRNLLTQVEGRVENGIFVCNTIMPRYFQNPGYTGLISVFAHRDNSDEMVNGNTDRILLQAYSETNPNTIHDVTPPVISNIYIDDQSEFAATNNVQFKSTLHISATDDYGFNNQTITIGNGLDLKIDGGKKYGTELRSFVTLRDQGKTLDLDYPIELLEGHHTLQFTTHDIAGNRASRVFDFYVGGQQVALSVEQEPASEVATFNLTAPEGSNPEVKIMVFNSTGQYVWYTTTSSFPFDWDLKNRRGKRLPAGVYKYYGKYTSGNSFGGTNTGTLIIADPTKKK